MPAGEQVPALHPPELEPDEADLYVMFTRLGCSRPLGMSGAGPIPMRDIQSYIEMIPPPDWIEVEDMIDVIQAGDTVWLKHQYDDQKKAK